MKFSFSSTGSGSTTSHTIECEMLDDVLSAFSYFLMGCGFHLGGAVGIIEEEEACDPLNHPVEQEMPINNVLNLVVAACEAGAIKAEFLPHIIDALVEAGCEVHSPDTDLA